MKYKEVVVGMRVSPYGVDLDEDIPILIIKDAKSDGTWVNTKGRWYELSDFYPLDKEPFKPGDIVVCTRNHGLNLMGLTLEVKEIRHSCFKNKGIDMWHESFYNADYFELKED